ncbi:Meiosis-specific protein MEI4 [Takifugu flavidus]|uniref:Meiosis-specific protein MEI4 n=1 Tax=Takifugu flavidus TaxID=433684 RepID=A0A5C6NN31_9TELE|nr:Meiosis-specific protein MEI4 [Takifugu flavidus]
MESKTSNLQGACRRQWALSQARVALALVLVKIKPSGVSARQYADALASKLRILDEGWKKEARDLQEQVLRLRQELLMSRWWRRCRWCRGGWQPAAARQQVAETVTLCLFMVPGCDRTVDPASQDLFGPECVVQTDSETPELLPSVPLQRPADTPRLQERPQEVFPHVEFLQSLCALQRVRGDDHGLEPLWFPPDADAGSLLADSVCQLLDSVVKACKDPPPFGPGDPVLQACRVVSQATDLFCSQRLPSVEFKRGVESSLEELTEMLLHRDWSSQSVLVFGLTDGSRFPSPEDFICLEQISGMMEMMMSSEDSSFTGHLCLYWWAGLQVGWSPGGLVYGWAGLQEAERMIRPEPTQATELWVVRVVDASPAPPNTWCSHQFLWINETTRISGPPPGWI